jgi:hypothetical protein
VEDRCRKVNPRRESTPSGIDISQTRRFVSWSCKELHQGLRGREERYHDNCRLACGTARASGRQVAEIRDLANSGVRRVKAQILEVSSCEDARL